MIQRVQTLFLLLTTTLLGLLFKFPFIKFIGEPNVFYSVLELKTEDGTPLPLDGKYVVVSLVIAVIILTLIAISQFKNRILQMNLVRFSIFLNLGIVAALFYYIGQNQENVGEGYQLSYGLGYGFVTVAIISSFLALHFIGKDEKLVKSVDRLR